MAFGIPEGPNSEFWFGADLSGRDVFVRTIYGARVSRAVAVGSIILSGVAGIIAGLVAGYYARLDALVHSSVQPEPFGLTIVEAMASGVPVVAARGGGPAEIIDEGVDGLRNEGDAFADRNTPPCGLGTA